MDAEQWRQAKAVLAEVLTRPPDERDAFLVERCPNPDLRRDVASYLRRYDEEFLKTVTTPSDGAIAVPADDDLDFEPGTRIGRYVVLYRLGTGGMGRVFLCNDTQLHRRVALKCLTSRDSPTEVRARLLQEARAGARIKHSNVATVYDVFEHDGRAFLVMEYVDGESLADLLRREPLTVNRALSIGRQLASGLGAAHAEGIVHRDLKPANVQVMRNGSVKVLDFGVAHAISLLTSESTVSGGSRARSSVPQPGTPAYMSPEQLYGRVVDHRSDIYSLGVVMYEMVTGHRPYSTTDPLELIIELGKRLIRPIDADPKVPREVSDVVARCLAHDPNERFQTAAALESTLASLESRYAVLPAVAIAVPVPWWRKAIRVTAILFSIPIVVLVLGFLMTELLN
jgi:serine/threonine protein kinase